MKKENKLIISEILLHLETNWETGMKPILEHIDLSDEAYLEAKQDFNKLNVE